MTYTIAKLGSFYVGGRDISIKNKPPQLVKRNEQMTITIDPNGDYSIESMYVQYFIPEHADKKCILLHGGGHTGAVWETTCDGREGFLHFLLEQGFAVYIVDSVERGRASWCAFDEVWPDKPEMKSHQTLWKSCRFGLEENFKKIAFENQQFPVDYFDTFARYDVPRWNHNSEASASALAILVNKIGPCYLIAHSQGADIAMKAFNQSSDLIDKVVLLEPAGFPDLDKYMHDTSNHTHSLMMIYGDYIAGHALWEDLFIKSKQYKEYLSTLNIDVEYIELPKMNIKGNSHMLFMDKNNRDIFDIVLEFLNKPK